VTNHNAAFFLFSFVISLFVYLFALSVARFLQ